MTIEQLKERIEATCMKHGMLATEVDIDLYDTSCDEEFDEDIYCYLRLDSLNNNLTSLYSPTAYLLLEKLDLLCREIKARQSSATNGID